MSKILIFNKQIDKLLVYGVKYLFSVKMCPQSHPFAFENGKSCCSRNKEEDNSFLRRIHGAKCDGSTIAYDSLCCRANGGKPCPNKPCQNYEGKYSSSTYTIF